MKNERILPSIIIAMAIIVSSSMILSEIKPIMQNGFISISQASQPNNQQQEETQYKGLMNLSEAASYIGIGTDRIILLISHYDDFPYNRFGDKYVFSKESLEEWFESSNIDSYY